MNFSHRIQRFTRTMRATLALALAANLTVALSACSTTVALESAKDANSPACAAVTVRMPDSIDNFAKRTTDAQATAAWGSPTAVILRCGLPEVKVSQLKCVTAGGVDWLVDESNAPNFRFISFGRNPATEVIIDSNRVSGATVLEALGKGVDRTPKTASCTG